MLILVWGLELVLALEPEPELLFMLYRCCIYAEAGQKSRWASGKEDQLNQHSSY